MNIGTPAFARKQTDLENQQRLLLPSQARGASEAQFFEFTGLISQGLVTIDFMTSMRDTFNTVSRFEVSLFAFQMLFMVCRPDMNALWYPVIGLGHPLRSLVGRYIAHQIPCPQTLLDEANINGGPP